MTEPELDIEDPSALLNYLRQSARINAEETPRIETLAGGVSNRTVLVERGDGKAWVLKQALSKLRVPVDWFSSPERIHREASGLRWLRKLAPAGTIPEFLFEDAAVHLLAMEAVAKPHENWKQRLLEGKVDSSYVRQFAELLAEVHVRGSALKDELLPVFSDRTYFESLRLEPYYEYAGAQVPEARDFLVEVIHENRSLALTLVHGDYSPKNILVYAGKLILLDHEVIHFGDPAFDLGFSLTHFLSKAHHLREERQQFADAARYYWQTYAKTLGGLETFGDLQGRAVKNTLACLLARVAGRSVLEYLSKTECQRQAEIVLTLMKRPPESLESLVKQFVQGL